MIIYYAYVNAETKQWYLYRDNNIHRTNMYLLYTLRCQYTSEPLRIPDLTQIDEGGVYTTSDNRRIEVLEKCWYGLKYDKN